MPTFGERLKAAQRLRGVSNARLAYLLHGQDQKNITRWRSSRHAPRWSLAIAIADVLEVSLDYLAGRTAVPELATSRPEGAMLEELERLAEEAARQDQDTDLPDDEADEPPAQSR